MCGVCVVSECVCVCVYVHVVCVPGVRACVRACVRGLRAHTDGLEVVEHLLVLELAVTVCVHHFH